MQGFTVVMMKVAGNYTLIICTITLLTLLLGTGVIFSRTKTLASAMLFFGLIACISTGSLGYLILPRLGVKMSLSFMNLAYFISSIILAIGLLLFAISLPKK